MDDNEILAGLEDNFDVPNPEDLLMPHVLTDIELVDAYQDVKEKILERGEGLQQTTDEGRRLHSERTALLVELAKRGLR